MEHKVLIIGGGVAAVAVVGFLVVRNKNKNAAADQVAANTAADNSSALAAFTTGMSPMSAGASSQYVSPVDNPGNSGTTDTGGGFDIMSLLSTYMSGSGKTAADAAANTVKTTDAALLAGVNVGSGGGTATITHNADGSSALNVAPNADPFTQIVTALYQKDLGRAPDAGGLAFYKNALMNGGATAAGLDKELLASPEYLAAHPITKAADAKP